MPVLECVPQDINSKPQPPKKHRLVAEWHQVNGQLTCRWAPEAID